MVEQFLLQTDFSFLTFSLQVMDNDGKRLQHHFQTAISARMFSGDESWSEAFRDYFYVLHIQNVIGLLNLPRNFDWELPSISVGVLKLKFCQEEV